METLLQQTTESETALFLKGIEALCNALPKGGWEPEPVHRFSPGLYVREQFMPKGFLMLGHEHRGEALNIMLQGRARVFADGKVRELTAPCVFVSGPGRKVGLILEDTVWMNVHPNPDDERDIPTLEDRYVKKSEAAKLREAEKRNQIK
jgi:hypothetical protein